MTIRGLQPNLDFAEIAGIAQCYNSPQFYWPTEKLKCEIDSCEGKVLMSQGRVAAYILYRQFGSNVLEIQSLATARDYCGTGMMQNLLKDLVVNAKQCQEIWLEVHAENRRAIAFYEKFGFKQVGNRPRYYTDGAAAILFTLELRN